MSNIEKNKLDTWFEGNRDSLINNIKEKGKNTLRKFNNGFPIYSSSLLIFLTLLITWNKAIKTPNSDTEIVYAENLLGNFLSNQIPKKTAPAMIIAIWKPTFTNTRYLLR